MVTEPLTLGAFEYQNDSLHSIHLLFSSDLLIIPAIFGTLPIGTAFHRPTVLNVMRVKYLPILACFTLHRFLHGMLILFVLSWLFGPQPSHSTQDTEEADTPSVQDNSSDTAGNP